MQLGGTASNSNIEIIPRFQNKALMIITNAPYYVTNLQLHRELNLLYVKDEAKIVASKYYNKIINHPNQLASDLISSLLHSKLCRLYRKAPLDLINI